MTDQELLKQLDGLRPEQCCCSDLGLDISGYCPAYVGSCYVHAKTRILFVGLAPKDADAATPSSVDRREGMRNLFQTHGKTWNPHLEGCLHVVSEIVKLDCRLDCCTSKKCYLRPESRCAFSFLAHTNAVKCFAGKRGSRYTAGSKPARTCLSAITLKEIKMLKPEMVILQGAEACTGFGQYLSTCGLRAWDGAYGAILKLDRQSGVSCRWVVFAHHPAYFARKRSRFPRGACWDEMRSAIAREPDLAKEILVNP